MNRGAPTMATVTEDRATSPNGLVGAVEQESPGEHLRNCLMMLEPHCGGLTADLSMSDDMRVVLEAVIHRLRCAVEQVEQQAAQLTVAKEMIRAGVACEQSIMMDLRRANQRIAHLSKELVRAQSRAGAA